MHPARIDLHSASGPFVTFSDSTQIAGASGYEGPLEFVQQTTAADVHPHDLHMPESLLDGMLLLPVAGAIALRLVQSRVIERFSFHVGRSP
jgi:hypothetical protein